MPDAAKCSAGLKLPTRPGVKATMVTCERPANHVGLHWAQGPEWRNESDRLTAVNFEWGNSW